MKTSRRLLLGTFLALLAAPVVLVAYSRIAGGSIRELPLPERTAPAQLQQLRDFSAVEVHGDLNVDIARAADFSVDYTPLSDRRGNFAARVEAGTLIIEGYGNRTEDTAATLRIGMPELTRVEAENPFALAIRNFDSPMLEVRIGVGGDILFENNRINTLDAELGYTGDVEFRGNTIGASRLSHFGLNLTTD